MNVAKYPTEKVSKNIYRFYSEGKSGKFDLRIEFSLMDEARQVYNLAFGVWDPIAQSIDDQIEVRNGDMDIILATVGQQALDFLTQNPQVSIAATGSVSPGKQPLRTRKYQMGISAYWPQLSLHYDVWGFVADRENGRILGYWPGWDGRWSPFEQGTNYDAFLLTLK